jgi:hypothetical protein
MTTTESIDEILNGIKLRFRYLEWLLRHMDMLEEASSCIENLQTIENELKPIIHNRIDSTPHEKLTARDYLNIIANLI